MNIIVIENGLLIFLLEIENTDSLLSDVPIYFINRITTFGTVYYFVDIAATIVADITATIISECIILIEGKLAFAVWANAAPEWISVTMLFYLNHFLPPIILVSPTAVSLRFAPFNFRYPDKLGIEDEFIFLI